MSGIRQEKSRRKSASAGSHHVPPRLGVSMSLTVFAVFIMLAMLALAPSPSYALQACSNNQICDVETVAGETVYSSCQSCGSTTTQCAVGTVSAPNTCRENAFAGTAECIEVQPRCEDFVFDVPTILLPFSVFTQRDIAVTITPLSQSGIAGRRLSYNVSVRNLNPIDINFAVSAELPDQWQSSQPATLSMRSNEQKSFTLIVTSRSDEVQGAYSVVLRLDNPAVGTVRRSLTYEVSSSQEADVTITPQSQTGIPGQALVYRVAVRNADPAGFDPSTFIVNAQLPQGWSQVVEPRSRSIAAGSSFTFNLTITSSLAPDDSNTIPVSVTSSSSSVTAELEYNVQRCGDLVCQVGEDHASCAVDCPLTSFTCTLADDRCEQQQDDGIAFAADTDFGNTNFLVCNRLSSPQVCKNTFLQNDCGTDRPCISGNSFANSADIKCVDSSGAYYLYGEDGFGSGRRSANFSFECPYVNLAQITELRNTFSLSLENFERGRSVLREQAAASSIDRAGIQPCIDAHTSIITRLTSHVSYLEQVIAHPALSNTTSARDITQSLRDDISAIYESSCRGARGLLVIDSLDISATEENTPAVASVQVSNTGDTPYFGFVRCDFISANSSAVSGTSPEGRLSVQSQCTEMQPNARQQFSLSSVLQQTGDWSLQCRTFGSQDSSCREELHDTRSAQFSVFTKNVFVQSVSASPVGDGTVGSRASVCNVTLNSRQADCAACSIDSIPCSSSGSGTGTFSFTCPARPIGTHNVTGSVFSTDFCIPTQPVEKSVSFRIPGLGDGVVDAGEQCEPTNADNNRYCPHANNTFVCEGLLYGERDEYGFCSPSATCFGDAFVFSCQKNRCGANCSDGETRQVTVNRSGALVRCTEQCGPACTFLSCEDSPSSGPIILTGEPKVSILSASCSYNTQSRRYDVTVGANWSGGDHARVEIEDRLDPQHVRSHAFNFTGSVAGQGTKQVSVEVHDLNNNVLERSDSRAVLCGSGNSTGSAIDVFRSLPNRVSLGTQTVKLTVRSTIAAENVEINELFDQSLEPQNFAVTGVPRQRVRESAVLPATYKDRTFSQKQWVISTLQPGSEVNITYSVPLSQPGRYSFISVWRYLGQEDDKEFNLDAFSCRQVNRVSASNGEQCSQFETPCDVPPGYLPVSSCEAEAPAPASGGPDILVISVVIIIVAGLGYRFREAIIEKLGPVISRFRRKQYE